MKFKSFLWIARVRKGGIVSGSALLVTATMVAGLVVKLEKLEAASQLPAAPPRPEALAERSPASGQEVNFNRDIAPIFRASCVACHSAQKPQARLRLDSEALVLLGGVSGKAIIPGNSKDSLLVKRLVGSSDGPRMPAGADPLPEDQIKLIRDWIDHGSFAMEKANISKVGLSLEASHPQAVTGSPLFAGKIRLIFATRCSQCHGPEVQQNGLRLDSLASILKGSNNGKVVIPGNSERSPLRRRLEGLDHPQMPYGGPPLSENEINLIRQWIDQGAQGPDSTGPVLASKPVMHWAFVKPVRPDLPQVKNASWCRNPIDYFILARLEKERVSPSPEASRETLIRRLSLDLIGLPPTLQEVDSFLADNSPDAYDKAVDRLLASPHYGERWARPWLDLARYADSHGYEADPLRVAWKWRDWVISALNQDVSYREFTIEQMAGDMFPNPTTDQLVATGFHRNTMLNKEGGTDPLEQRWISLVERVNTTATVWLGITLECAQCHNHKFDPFTQKDYYRFLAFFENADYEILPKDEWWVHEPDLELPTPEQGAKRNELKAEIAKVQTALSTSIPEVEAAQAQWEREMKGAHANWTVLRPSHLSSMGGATLTVLDDESVLASGKNPEADTYVIEAGTDLSKITGVRLEVMNDSSLPQAGPGRDPEGNFVLTEFELSAAPVDKPKSVQKVVIKDAVANESQEGYDISNLVKASIQATGWAIDTSPSKVPLRRQAVLVPDKPFGFEHGTLLSIRMIHNMRHATRNIGRFRLSVTSLADPVSIVQVPARLLPALDIPVATRTKEQKEAVAAAFRSVTPLLKRERDRLAELQKEVDKLGIATALIMRERQSFERPSAYMRIRGSYFSKGEKVYADVPGVLPSLPKDVMPNRLGLASWLVDENNPLTARVEVNRIWETIFGRGIVETSENFGTQGTPPTHPELLDWLATEFMRQGSSMKKLIRLIVTSSTYRESSRVTPELLEHDTYNKLLARGPRFRGEAEMVRDIALAASGLLSPKIGGPSVFPYQPEGIWDRPYSEDKWVMSEGEDRYRRGIYTFIRRTAPYPSLTTFDAPSREFCAVRRVRTNTPLQALTTLNDQAFFEAAQALAKRMMTEAGPDPSARATYGFRLCVTRQPATIELEQILAFHDQQLGRFRKHPEAASAVVKGITNPPSDTADLAAWTMVSKVLLNLDETITKE